LVPRTNFSVSANRQIPEIRHWHNHCLLTGMATLTASEKDPTM